MYKESVENRPKNFLKLTPTLGIKLDKTIPFIERIFLFQAK